MDILATSIQMVPKDQISSEIKAFILLINNCRPNGEIITYLLVNRLIDDIIVNYLESIGKHNSQKNVDL